MRDEDESLTRENSLDNGRKEVETKKEVSFLRNFAVKRSREMVEAGGKYWVESLFLDETLQHVYMLM